MTHSCEHSSVIRSFKAGSRRDSSFYLSKHVRQCWASKRPSVNTRESFSIPGPVYLFVRLGSITSSGEDFTTLGIKETIRQQLKQSVPQSLSTPRRSKDELILQQTKGRERAQRPAALCPPVRQLHVHVRESGSQQHQEATIAAEGCSWATEKTSNGKIFNSDSLLVRGLQGILKNLPRPRCSESKPCLRNHAH